MALVRWQAGRLLGLGWRDRLQRLAGWLSIRYYCSFSAIHLVCVYMQWQRAMIGGGWQLPNSVQLLKRARERRVNKSA
jgi:hypothetical protein